MNKNDFYRLLAQAVQFSPDVPGEKIESLQTFGVVRSMAEASTTNLGKTILDKDGPFFFSKKWNALGSPANNVVFEYPALLVVDRFGNASGLFTNKIEVGSNIQLAALYPNVEKLEDTTLKAMCSQVPIPEIYSRMNALLLAALKYVSGAIYATVDGSPGWHNKAQLDAALAAAEIGSYILHEKETNAFKKRMTTANTQADIGYIDDAGSDLLCGVSYTITFKEVFCDASVYDFDVANCCNLF